MVIYVYQPTVTTVDNQPNGGDTMDTDIVTLDPEARRLSDSDAAELDAVEDAQC